MRINLSRHGLGPRRRGLGASAVDDFLSYAKSTAGQIIGDRGVKSRIVAEAIKSVTGIAPVVDTRDPKVTWVRTTPEHAKWIEAVFMKSVLTDPTKKPADMKIDAMPALNPLFLKRIMPALAIALGGVFAVGYMAGRK